ncbi:hypothetical protein DTO039G3_8013 [Penicillium roqueforti]|nr:hypothetical protein DTO039G3_8013 [Penicillium roqueforti]
MAQTLDLGKSTLRIRDSKLQLRLAASAHFNQSPSHPTPEIPIDLSQLSNLESIWITEAPELELRFWIGGNWDQNEAAAFISKLRDKLCDMEIWSDLGFSVELKRYCIETSGFHFLQLGMHRGCLARNHTTGRTLPGSMTNPPDARPPPGVPVATLASIDVRLEYRFQAKDVSQAEDCSVLEVSLLGQGISVVSSPHVLEEMVETKILLPMHDENSYAAVRQQTVRISGKRSPSSEELFRLFDLGIQRRIISNSIKDPTVSVSQKSTIKSFADIFPAVFDPGYRDAMNQRGVTIPMITKAISSLVVGNKNLSTKAKLADLLELTSSHQTGDLAIQPQLPSCNNAVFSSLWCVAQNNVPRIKPRRRGVSMLFTEFPSNALAGLDELVDLTSIDQHQPDNENPGQCHSSQTKYHDENEESDVCLLNSESEDQLLDNFSETSFTDIGESTQTSLDTLLSTTGSSQTSYGDRDAMLLSDHGELADYPENYVIDYDPREDMEACDADIIMADYL